MPKSKVWPAASAMSFKLNLFIQEVKNLPMDKLEDCGSSFMVQIEWRGSSSKSSFLLRGFKRSRTSAREIQRNGSVSWNEGFNHACKLKRINSHNWKSWVINLEIQEINQNLRGKLSIIGRTMVDVAEFSLPEDENSIRIPINCRIRGHPADVVLMIKLHLTEVQTEDKNEFILPRALSLRSFSCTRAPQTYSGRGKQPVTGPGSSATGHSSSDEEPDFHYKNLARINFLLIGQHTEKLDDDHYLEERHLRQPSDQPKLQKQPPSLVRLLSWNKTRTLSFKALNRYKGQPLLNKACHEDGGDDIDNDRRHELSIQLSKLSHQIKVQPRKLSQSSRFEDDNKFEVGNWVKKMFVSRDGQLELVTDIFLASIDQHSEKAAGGSACTVLAVIIADWLHNNPKTLPLRCQLDELVREGSFEWRKLCENENHKEKFFDKHFDLDTVLEANLRPLSVVTERSYIGFFSLDDMPDSFDFLQGATSFDSIWTELLCDDACEERIYITSWNDHFFVLKVESDVIYLIDTLGERLFEGCNQAHILKFDKKSAVRKRYTEPGCQTESSKECIIKSPQIGGMDAENSSSQQIFCEGMDSCKEYIKGFLAALPLRELQDDIKRGLMKKVPLHRRLQIEFHYVAPCKSS